MMNRNGVLTLKLPKGIYGAVAGLGFNHRFFNPSPVVFLQLQCTPFILTNTYSVKVLPNF